MKKGSYRASWWLAGGHAQTLWPWVVGRVRLAVRTEQLELPDGDFVCLDWVGQRGPIVVILPGLQGDLKSGYVRRLLRACHLRGWRAVLLNYRGCGRPNRQLASYHCGKTDDLHYLTQLLHQREPATPLAVVGFSLGANISLKWLGEAGQRGQALPVVATVGVSAPFNLGVVARHIERGIPRIYQHYLLQSLRNDVQRKLDAGYTQLGLRPGELNTLRTFPRFDERITAPINGFAGADDYYQKTRTDELLGYVRVPTLLLSSRNDPLVPARLIPQPSEISSHVTLEVTETGGHMGFTFGRWPWATRFWLDDRIPDYLTKYF